MSKQVAIVKSWDTALGTGSLSQDGLDDIEITRAMLIAGDDLRVGERVVIERRYEADLDGAWGWSYGDVKVVSEDEVAAIELERLCSEVEHADSRLNAASELASDDDVESARDDLVRADAVRRARVPQIGAALYERGGEDAMRTVLRQVDSKHRATIAIAWRGIGAWEG